MSAPPAPPPENGEADLLAGDELNLADATPAPGEDLTSVGLLEGGAAPPTSTAATPASTPIAEMKPAEERVAAGGWYRPAESFTLYYRPGGHADPFLVAWLTASTRLGGASGPVGQRRAKLSSACPIRRHRVFA